MDIITKKVLRQKKRVVLIIVQALSAGKDLRNLKEKVRFGIESRRSQLANGAQGIAGRLCGYHNNRDFKLMANIDLLYHYAEFEQDWEVYSDDEWKERLYDLGIRKFSTQTTQRLVRKSGIVRPIKSVRSITIEDLVKPHVKEQLSFINDTYYNKLLNYFEKETYNSETKGARFGQNGVTIRLASSYKKDDNRVYKNWKSSVVGADFGSIMFKKQDYDYGILISNYPVDDDRNTIGFCGIKVLESSEPLEVEQETVTENTSMYILINSETEIFSA